MTPAQHQTPTPAASELVIETVTESPLWEREPASEATLRDAITAAARHSAESGLDCRGEIGILLGDDAGVQALNRAWRGIDKPTNVLSFPAAEQPEGGTALPPLGDIAIAFETVAREALAEGKPFHHHLAHLGIHGFLHLLGFDHENDADAEEMEAHERRILQSLSIPDPYAMPDGA